MTTRFLFSQDRLTIFKEGCVDLVDVIYFVGYEVGNNQVKPAAGRKRNFRSGQKVERGWQIKLQSYGKGHCSFLLGLIVGLAPDAGEHLPVYIGFLIDGHVIHATGVYQLEQALLERLSSTAEHLIQTLSGNIRQCTNRW